MRSAVNAVSPFDEIPRDEWARLSQQTPLPLSEQDVAKLRGLGDRVDLQEVDAVYRPISRLLNIQVAAAQQLRMARGDFLPQRQHRTWRQMGFIRGHSQSPPGKPYRRTEHR